MSTIAAEPLLHLALRQPTPKIQPIKSRKNLPFSLNFSSRASKIRGSFSSNSIQKSVSVAHCTATTTLAQISEPTEVVYSEEFELPRLNKV